jgi:hypothetical protein
LALGYGRLVPVTTMSTFQRCWRKGGVFEPLRDWVLFVTAEVGPNGRAVLWRIGDKIVELSADTLWPMARGSR